MRKASSSGFTGQLFDSMRAGTLLRIEGPLGQFWFRGESPRAPLFIGGGTGYAPLRAMLRQLLAQGDRRPVTLYWGGRNVPDLYEHDWLLDVAAQRAGLDYRPVLSDAETGTWDGRTGLVHEAVLRDIPALAAHDVYASGPPGMIEVIRLGRHHDVRPESYRRAPGTRPESSRPRSCRRSRRRAPAPCGTRGSVSVPA